MGCTADGGAVPAVPLHGQSPLVTGERGGSVRSVSKLPRHRPLSRTQSSPLPQSPQALPHGALPHGALQHHFLDKQQVQLGKVGQGVAVGQGLLWGRSCCGAGAAVGLGEGTV